MSRKKLYSFSDVAAILDKTQFEVKKLMSNCTFYCYSFLISPRGKVFFYKNDYNPYFFPFYKCTPLPCAFQEAPNEILIEFINEDILMALFSSIADHAPFKSFSHLSFSTRYICDVRYLNKRHKLILVMWYEKPLHKKTFFRFFINDLLRVLNRVWTIDVFLLRENLVEECIDCTFQHCLSYKSRNENVYSPPMIIPLNKIAASYYESETAEGTIQFIDEPVKNYIPDVRLSKRMSVTNTKFARKLLVATGNAAIIVNLGIILGLSRISQIDTSETHIVKFSGHMKWTYFINGEEQFKSIDGNIVFSVDKNDTNSILQKWFTNFNTQFEDAIKHQFHFSHGAVLVISSDAEKEAQRLCSLNRGTQVNPFSVFENIDVFNGITSVDGAVILDPDGLCYAFGVILDGEAKIKGTPSRGSRYNSTRNYIYTQNQNNPPNKYIGIVISEDGMIDVFDPDTSDEQEDNSRRRLLEY